VRVWIDMTAPFAGETLAAENLRREGFLQPEPVPRLRPARMEALVA
jgi:hypothetical protein